MEPTNEEAQQVLREEMARLRNLPYKELLELLDKPVVKESQGPSGYTYSLEVEALRDRGEDLRVMAFVIPWDKRKVRIPRDLTADFIMAPDGSFVGE